MVLIFKQLKYIHKIFRNLLEFPKLQWKIHQFMANSKIGGNTHIGKCANCINSSGNKDNIIIGENCDIDAIIQTQGEGKIIVGDYTTIRYDSVIGAVDMIEIGNHVMISNHVTIYDNNNHPIEAYKRIKMCESGFTSELWQWKYSDHKPIKIGNNVWIGEKTTILKGVTIGDGAIVACNSVVTHDVDKNTIVAGNPACCVKKLK